MKTNGIVLLIYALLVIAGGVIGFVKANSMPSLLMGGLFGVGLLASAAMLLNGKQAGFYLGVILSLALLAFFSYRFYSTGSFMPAGLMSILSLATLVRLFFFR